MAYTARELIIQSLYLSNKISRGAEEPTKDDIAIGLSLLNDLLEMKVADQGLISYFKEYDFNSVIGQEMYFVQNLVSTEFLTFNIDSARFPSIKSTRYDYFGGGRIDGINALPVKFRAERVLGGTNIYLYFSPGDIYPMKLWGKFALSNVTLNTDMSLTYDRVYLTYLRYALAEFICDEINATFPTQAKNRLKSLELQIRSNMSEMDLSIKTISTMGATLYFNYGDINIGKGWRGE